MTGIDRRRFLAWLSGAAAGAALPALAAALVSCARHEALGGALGDFFAEPEAARGVGRRYLALHPEESDADTLVRRLARGDEAHWETLAPAALAAALRERHRADFAAERLTRLDGWVLSETEARLCALCALGAG